MYIRNNSEEYFITRASERAMNTANKTTSIGRYGSSAYTHFGHKTWPQIIRLYKEMKKEGSVRS